MYNAQIDFVSIAYDKNIDLVSKYIAENNMSWFNLFETGGKIAPIAGIAKAYRISSYPTLILIDPTGKIIFRDTGTDGFKRLKDLIKKKMAHKS